MAGFLIVLVLERETEKSLLLVHCRVSKEPWLHKPELAKCPRLLVSDISQSRSK